MDIIQYLDKYGYATHKLAINELSMSARSSMRLLVELGERTEKDMERLLSLVDAAIELRDDLESALKNIK
jgi:hypothetical protein